MVALATVVIVVLLSLIVTRVATVVLTLTGVSWESARFQARSAFSGVGFTTSEAESIVGHPVRRRVVMALMLLGSAGLIAAISSLAVSFSRAGGEERLQRLGVLVGALVVIFLIARSPVVDRVFSRLVRRLLRRYTELDVRDYASLLELSGQWAVAELRVKPEDWVAGRTLAKLGLREEGIAVLGVHRADGGYVGVPVADTVVRDGDRLLLYGTGAGLAELDARPAGEEGDRRHDDAVRSHHRVVVEQAATEAAATGSWG